MGNVLETIIFYPPEPVKFQPNSSLFVLKDGERELPFYWFYKAENKYTIIFSHGNHTQIHDYLKFGQTIHWQCHVNVIIYEYFGFGWTKSLSGNHEYPSEKLCYLAIDMICDFLINQYQIPVNRIILLGHSLGNGPNFYLASSRPVAGIIAISPFISILSVLDNAPISSTFDIFPNLSRLQSINCPIYFLHGNNDTLVPSCHSLILSQQAKISWKCELLPNFGHMNILSCPDLFSKISTFILSVTLDFI